MGSVPEISTSVWISLMPEVTEMRIRQILTQEICFTREIFERFGLTAQCLGCRAIRTGIGYPAKHTERRRERIEQELEKEPEGASKVARDR